MSLFLHLNKLFLRSFVCYHKNLFILNMAIVLYQDVLLCDVKLETCKMLQELPHPVVIRIVLIRSDTCLPLRCAMIMF